MMLVVSKTASKADQNTDPKRLVAQRQLRLHKNYASKTKSKNRITTRSGLQVPACDPAYKPGYEETARNQPLRPRSTKPLLFWLKNRTKMLWKFLPESLENIKPQMEVKARRIGGAAYQVPTPVRGDRREALGLRWLITASRARPSREYHTFAEKLVAELIDAQTNLGAAVKKKLDTHQDGRGQ